MLRIILNKDVPKNRFFNQNFEYIFFVFNFSYLLFTNSTILEIAFVASGIGKAGYTWFKFSPTTKVVSTLASLVYLLEVLHQDIEVHVYQRIEVPEVNLSYHHTMEKLSNLISLHHQPKI